MTYTECKAQYFDRIRDVVNSGAGGFDLAERTRKIVWEYDDERDEQEDGE